MFFQDVIMFMAVNPQTGTFYFTSNFYQEAMPAYKLLIVPQAWTIGVELLFYLTVPFLVKRRNITLIAIVVTSIVLRFYMAKKGFGHDPWNYRFFPFEIGLFILGGLGYRAYARIQYLRNINYISAAILVCVIISLFAFQFLPIGGNIKRLFSFYIAIGISIPFIFHASRKSKYDRVIGELSYPVYITHHIIATCSYLFFEKFTLELHERQLFCIPIIFLSLLTSFLINKYIQQPIDLIRRR